MSTYMMATGAELPIGYIFEFDPTGLSNAPDLSTAAKVREYFGYGTWEAYGAGRVTVSVGSGYAVGSEGGEATHTLSVDEMPSHEHKVFINYLQYELNGSYYMMNNFKIGSAIYGDFTNPDGNGGSAGFGGAKPTGGNKPHNNMQPYRTVYRWRRIA